MIIAVVGLLTLFTSAYYTAPADGRISCKAPSLKLGDTNNDLSPLKQHLGEKILLTFWSSDDAQSHLNNMRYDRLSRATGASCTHVSVNLNRSAQLSAAQDMQDNIIRNWRLEDGCHSFLIDSNGVIIAIDSDATSLFKLN